MTAHTRLFLPVSRVNATLGLACLICFSAASAAGPKPDTYWHVEDVKAGMKGTGRTVMRGTKVEPFQAEVLGVLKNTSPGRDLVLCRLSGLNLDKTGVIAGMSGSPVYIDGKLLGAVAYAWAYGKEPIAGVTPFSQMHSFVEAFERRDLAEQAKPSRVGLAAPVRIDGREFDAVTVSQDFKEHKPSADDGLWMTPLRTPLAASGFTPHSLGLLSARVRDAGFVPVQGGGVSAKIGEEEKDTPLEPGGPLAIALISGDFDLSGIGTTTHVEGNRVYGWGHPFLGVGGCDFPLMTGYIHTIYPRQSISFKLGSPLRTVGLINADVSTGVAGWLGRKPELLPLRATVQREGDGTPRTFNVQIVRQRSLMATLVYSALTNAVDTEGELPEELTAEMKVTVEVEGRPPLVIEDTFSGFSGGRAPQALFSHPANLVNQLVYNVYQPVRISRIECEAQIVSGRRTADIEAVELDSDVYEPGDTLRATVYLRPYKGPRQRVPVTLKLPADLPEGSYTASVYDELTAARNDLRDNPTWNFPQNLDQVFEALRVQTAARRTNLAVRVPLRTAGVALGEKALPNLPPSMVQVLGQGKRTGAQGMSAAVVERHPTDWVIQGSDSVKFVVTRNKKLTR